LAASVKWLETLNRISVEFATAIKEGKIKEYHPIKPHVPLDIQFYLKFGHFVR
jgi:hypothetical protein